MKKYLNQLIAGKSTDEVSLFRAMHQTFNAHFKCTLLEETHQNYVFFNSNSIPNPNQVKREISDLWIIAYSPQQKIAKMTFLQAKFINKKNYKIHPNFKFSGEYFQYELLSRRPAIIDSSKFNFPTDILSFSNFHSIGTFGIFYYDSNNDIDMAYCIASQMGCKIGKLKKQHTPRVMTFPKIKKNEYIILKHSSNDLELCTTLSIDIFTMGVLGLNIGAPIHDNRNIRIYLGNLFQSLVADPVVADFLKFLSGFDNTTQDAPQNNDGLIPRVLMINIDGKN